LVALGAAFDGAGFRAVRPAGHEIGGDDAKQFPESEPGPRLAIPASVLVRHRPSLRQTPGLHLAHRIPAGARARGHLPEKRRKRDPWAVDPISLIREDLRRNEPADQSRQAVRILRFLPQSFARHSAFGPFGRARFHRLADNGFRHRSTLPAGLTPPCYEPVTICLNLAPFRSDPLIHLYASGSTTRATVPIVQPHLMYSFVHLQYHHTTS